MKWPTIRSLYLRESFLPSLGLTTDFPPKLNLETINWCNRKCPFCPTGLGELDGKKTKLEFDIIEKIANELESHSFRGVISFQARNEPLLDHRIVDIVTCLRSICPKSFLSMSTNADKASEDIIRDLFAAGLNAFSMQLYDKSNRKRLNKFKTDALDSVPELYDEKSVSVQGRKERFIWITDKTPWKKDEGKFSNRGGSLDLTYEKKKLRENRLHCHFPSHQLLILADGSVPLCCNDWHAEVKMGNVKNESIYDIWNCETFDKYRSHLKKMDFSLPICNNCDYGLYE